MIPVLKTNLMRKAQESLEKNDQCEDAMTMSGNRFAKEIHCDRNVISINQIVIINLLKDSCSLQNERANLIHGRKANHEQASHLRAESTFFGIVSTNYSSVTSQSCKYLRTDCHLEQQIVISCTRAHSVLYNSCYKTQQFLE